MFSVIGNGYPIGIHIIAVYAVLSGMETSSWIKIGEIFAVDDTPASLKLLTELLQSAGYEVRSAISGELALHSASTIRRS